MAKNHEQFEFDFDALKNSDIFNLFIQHSSYEMNDENIIYSFIWDLLVESKLDHSDNIIASKNPILRFFKAQAITNLIVTELERSKIEFDKMISYKEIRKSLRIRSLDYFNHEDMKWLIEDDGSLVDYVKKFMIWKTIISVFIEDCKDHSLNISNNSRYSILEHWKLIKQKYKDSLQLYKIKGFIEDKSIDLSCFTSCNQEVNQTLWLDMFSRFKRSSMFLSHVNNLHIDKVRDFGHPLGSSSLRQYILSVTDMSRPFISEKEIELVEILVQDLYHWKSIYSDPKKKLNIFSSSFPILDSECQSLYGNVISYKSTFTFDCSASDFIMMFTNPNNYLKLSELKRVTLLDYIDANGASIDLKKDFFGEKYIEKVSTSLLSHLLKGVGKNPGSCVIKTEIDGLIKREFIQTCTLYYKKGTFYFIFKSCQHPRAPFEKFCRGVSFGVIAISPITEHTCQYQTIFFVNLRGLVGSLNSGKLAQKAMIAQVCNSYKNLKKILKTSPTSHKDEFLFLYSLIDQFT